MAALSIDHGRTPEQWSNEKVGQLMESLDAFCRSIEGLGSNYDDTQFLDDVIEMSVEAIHTSENALSSGLIPVELRSALQIRNKQTLDRLRPVVTTQTTLAIVKVLSALDQGGITTDNIRQYSNNAVYTETFRKILALNTEICNGSALIHFSDTNFRNAYERLLRFVDILTESGKQLNAVVPHSAHPSLSPREAPSGLESTALIISGFRDVITHLFRKNEDALEKRRFKWRYLIFLLLASSPFIAEHFASPKVGYDTRYGSGIANMLDKFPVKKINNFFARLDTDFRFDIKYTPLSADERGDTPDKAEALLDRCITLQSAYDENTARKEEEKTFLQKLNPFNSSVNSSNPRPQCSWIPTGQVHAAEFIEMARYLVEDNSFNGKNLDVIMAALIRKGVLDITAKPDVMALYHATQGYWSREVLDANIDNGDHLKYNLFPAGAILMSADYDPQKKILNKETMKPFIILHHERVSETDGYVHVLSNTVRADSVNELGNQLVQGVQSVVLNVDSSIDQYSGLDTILKRTVVKIPYSIATIENNGKTETVVFGTSRNNRLEVRTLPSVVSKGGDPSYYFNWWNGDSLPHDEHPSFEDSKAIDELRANTNMSGANYSLRSHATVVVNGEEIDVTDLNMSRSLPTDRDLPSMGGQDIGSADVAYPSSHYQKPDALNISASGRVPLKNSVISVNGTVDNAVLNRLGALRHEIPGSGKIYSYDYGDLLQEMSKSSDLVTLLKQWGISKKDFQAYQLPPEYKAYEETGMYFPMVKRNSRKSPPGVLYAYQLDNAQWYIKPDQVKAFAYITEVINKSTLTQKIGGSINLWDLAEFIVIESGGDLNAKRGSYEHFCQSNKRSRSDLSRHNKLNKSTLEKYKGNFWVAAMSCSYPKVAANDYAPLRNTLENLKKQGVEAPLWFWYYVHQQGATGASKMMTRIYKRMVSDGVVKPGLSHLDQYRSIFNVYHSGNPPYRQKLEGQNYALYPAYSMKALQQYVMIDWPEITNEEKQLILDHIDTNQTKAYPSRVLNLHPYILKSMVRLIKQYPKIRFSSTHRSFAHNQSVGGVHNSDHPARIGYDISRFWFDNSGKAKKEMIKVEIDEILAFLNNDSNIFSFFHKVKGGHPHFHVSLRLPNYGNLTGKYKLEATKLPGIQAYGGHCSLNGEKCDDKSHVLFTASATPPFSQPPQQQLVAQPAPQQVESQPNVLSSAERIDTTKIKAMDWTGLTEELTDAQLEALEAQLAPHVKRAIDYTKKDELGNAYTSEPVTIVEVSGDTQNIYTIKPQSGKLIYFAKISSSSVISNIQGSNGTPLGTHIVTSDDFIGDGQPVGMSFVGKKPQGIVKIYRDDTDLNEDKMTTRILAFRGVIPEVNKGKNAKGQVVDSFLRNIYAHGTDEEGLIGKHASHGCLRFTNTAIQELFNGLKSIAGGKIFPFEMVRKI